MKPQLLSLPEQILTERLILRCYHEGEGVQRDQVVRRDGSLTGPLCYGLTRADYANLALTWS